MRPGGSQLALPGHSIRTSSSSFTTHVGNTTTTTTTTTTVEETTTVSYSGDGAPPAQQPAEPPPAVQAQEVPPASAAITNPPGHGQVLVQPGDPVASNAGQPEGAGFEGKIARQSLAALQRAGGVSAAYVSAANGNREVDVHAPQGFDPSKPYEVLVYNRGIKGDNAKSLDGQFVGQMMRELNQGGRNVLLVLPKSPTNTERWFAGKEDLGKLVPEALQQFRAQTGMPLGEPTGKILMAHSGGGASVRNALQKPNPPHFDQILLADSTYGTWAGDALAAMRNQPRTQLAAVVSDPKNVPRARQQLVNQGVRVDPMPAHFPYPGHNGVPAYMFRAFLGADATKTFTTVGR
jgi:hypothetical protein